MPTSLSNTTFAEESLAAAPRTIPLSIISNSSLLREGLATILNAYDDLSVVSTHRGDLSASVSSQVLVHHVVLVDCSIGHEAAIQWTHQWRRMAPPVHVVVLELANDYDLILACIEAGASGYVLQGASIEDVIKAVRNAHRGVAYCSPEITARLFSRLASAHPLTEQPPEIVAALTSRELEVLRYVALDYSNQQIASRLVIELSTVKHHVHNILEKLKLKHRWGAAQFAHERGWLSDANAARVDQP